MNLYRCRNEASCALHRRPLVHALVISMLTLLILALARPAAFAQSVTYTSCGEQGSGNTDNTPLPVTTGGETLFVLANFGDAQANNDITGITNSGYATNPCTWSAVPGAYNNAAGAIGAAAGGPVDIWVCPNAVANSTVGNVAITSTVREQLSWSLPIYGDAGGGRADGRARRCEHQHDHDLDNDYRNSRDRQQRDP